MKHKNAHPLLKRARAYNALKMRRDMNFMHYHQLAQNCLAEYHRIQERNKRAEKARSEYLKRKEGA